MQGTEKFYPVKGFEGYYEISKQGTVRSVSRRINKKDGTIQPRIGKVIKPSLSNKGYYRVTLKVVELGVSRRFSIHRLLAINFIPNPNNYPNINHIIPITTNNDLENLEWCTQSQNIQHKFDLGYISTKRKVSEEGVIDIYTNTVLGKDQGRGYGRGNVTEMCEKYNISRIVVYNIIYGKSYLNITKKLKRRN